MASTNKTAHYNLSQYIGTDKPTYLVDYNTDMSAIDTAIYTVSGVASGASSKADTNETNIGTLSNLTTDVKTSLVGAINEVDSHADTNTTNIATNTSAIGTLANLETTTKNNLVGAINENRSDINKLDLIYFDSYAGTDMTASTGTVADWSTITVASNSDGSIGKVYGTIQLTSGTGNVVITIASTKLRPDTDITINNACITLYGSSVIGEDITIKTNGNIELSLYVTGTGQSIVSRHTAMPCLYFMKNFGDTPSQ